MSYIGVIPAEAYASFYVQHFTTSATTSYALDYPVVNENDLRLVINNVVQQPGSSYAYTAAASTLTLSAATTTSDTMYTVFLGRALQTVNPPAGSVGTSQIEANAVTLAKIADGTQGDILYYGASGAPTLLGFGTSGDFLKTQGTGANPVWATAGGGKVLQCLQVYKQDRFSTDSQSWVDVTDMSLAITPAATTSKILVIASLTWNSTNWNAIKLVRTTTDIMIGDAATGAQANETISGVATASYGQSNASPMFLDSPSTTSATTYKVQGYCHSAASPLYFGRSTIDYDAVSTGSTPQTLTLIEIGA